MLRQGYTRYITCILFILLIVNMSASFTLNNNSNNYTLSPETKLQRILETLVYSPVVVEAYKYRRIIPYDSDLLTYPSLNPGEVTRNPCGPEFPMVDSKHYELYCWLERVFMPATNSLDIPNNTVASIPKGDSFLIVLGPTLLSQALAGVDNLNEIKSYNVLSKENWKRWWEAVPIKTGGIISYRYKMYSDRSHPDLLYAYYIHYYRDQLARDTGSPVSLLPMWKFRSAYYSLLGDINRFALSNNIDLSEYRKLIVEWEIIGNAGVLYPVIMSTRIPGDYIDYRVWPKPVFSPSAEVFSEDTRFPIPLPAFRTKYYVSFIDLNDPIRSIVDNMVFVGIEPWAYRSSFKLRITVKTLNHTVLTTLVYTFNIGSELWKFLETNTATTIWLPHLPLKSIVKNEYGSLADSLLQLKDIHVYVGCNYYGCPSVSLENASLIADPHRAIVYMNMPGYPLYSGEFLTISLTYRASVKIVGYGIYGEAIISATYWFRGFIDYKVESIHSRSEYIYPKGWSAHHYREKELTISAILRGGGALPYPSHIIIGDFYEGELKRVNRKEYIADRIGTGFLGYGFSKGYEKDEVVTNLYGRRTFSQHEELTLTKKVVSQPYCGSSQSYTPPPIKPLHIDIFSNLALINYGYTYTELQGLALLYIDAKPFYLTTIEFPEFDYGGTGKANFIPLSQLSIIGSDEAKGYTRYYSSYDTLRTNDFGYSYVADRGISTQGGQGCGDCPPKTTCVVDILNELWINGIVHNEWIETTRDSGIIRPYGTRVYFIPWFNTVYQPIESNTTYITAYPYIQEALPGSKVEYLVEGYYGGRKLSGDTLNIELLFNNTVLWNKTTVFGTSGATKVVVEIPSLTEILDRLGNESQKILSINNTNTTPTIPLSVIFSVPGKNLSTYSIIKLKLGLGVTGKILAVDFGIDYGTDQTLLLGFKTTNSWYDPFLNDPDLDEVPVDVLPFVSDIEEGIVENIARELGLNASVKLYVINQSDPSKVYVVQVDSTSYSLVLDRGSYRAFVEVNVTLWDGELVRFRTKEKEFNITGDEIARLDFKVPITPVLRALKMVQDVKEWKIVNADLAYLIENFFLVFTKPFSKAGLLLKLLTNTQEILSRASRTTCKIYYELLPALVMSIFHITDPSRITSYCDYLYNLSQTLGELINYVANGGSDQQVIRSYAIKMATVKIYFTAAKDIEEFIESRFLNGALPDYDTEKMIHNSFSPWNKLYRLMSALAFISNLRTHIIRQVRIGVKFFALNISLLMIQGVIKSKLFPFSKAVSKVVGWASNLLGGEKSIIVRTIARIFPSLRVALNAMKIGGFTLTGMGLNLGLTNDRVKQWLVPAGYKGIDVGYAIANFFKFYRFLLSVIIDTAETDTVFEIIFHITTQLSSFVFLGFTSFIIDLETQYFYKLVVSGDGEGTIYDVMKTGYVSDAATIGSLRILELVVSGLAFSVNFLRGVGGLIDFVSSAKSMAAIDRLLDKDSDGDILAYLIKLLRAERIVEFVHKNILKKFLNYISKFGKPMLELGKQLIKVVIATAIIDLLVSMLMSANTLFHLLYPTKTPLNKLVTDFGSIIKAFGRYKLVEATNPLNRSTYRNDPGLLEYIKSMFRPGGATQSAEDIPLRSNGDSGNAILAGPDTSNYWSITYNVEELVNDITYDLVENNYLNMSKLIELAEYNYELMDKLELKYIETLEKTPDDSIYILSTINSYEMLIDDFIKEAYLASISPHYSPSIVADLANMTTTILKEIRKLEPPTTPLNTYYVTVKQYTYGNTLKLEFNKISGIGSPVVEVRISSDQFNVSRSIWNINLDNTDHIEVELTPIDPNITVGIVDVSVLHSEYGLVGYSTFIVGVSDLFIPWSYNTSIGGVLSLKEIDIDILNNTAILIHNLGNDFLVINSTQPLSVNITSGGIYIRTLVIGDRYITTIWAVNTTDTIIALSTQIPQNTLTPTLPEIGQLGESSAPHESPLDKIVSNPVIMASIAVVIVVVVASIVKFILLKKAT